MAIASGLSGLLGGGKAEHAYRVGIARLDQGQCLFLLAHFGEGGSYGFRRELSVAGAANTASVLLLRYCDAAPGYGQRRKRRAGNVIDPLRQAVEQRYNLTQGS